MTSRKNARKPSQPKTAWGSDEMRRAFYQSSDGAFAVIEAAKAHPHDAALQAAAQAVMAAVDGLHAQLNARYTWD